LVNLPEKAVERSDPQLKLRLPAQLKKKLDDAARSARRLLSSEIVARLEASFEAEVPINTDNNVEPGPVYERRLSDCEKAHTALLSGFLDIWARLEALEKKS
jgi:hypothetical protein